MTQNSEGSKSCWRKINETMRQRDREACKNNGNVFQISILPGLTVAMPVEEKYNDKMVHVCTEDVPRIYVFLL